MSELDVDQFLFMWRKKCPQVWFIAFINSVKHDQHSTASENQTYLHKSTKILIKLYRVIPSVLYKYNSLIVLNRTLPTVSKTDPFPQNKIPSLEYYGNNVGQGGFSYLSTLCRPGVESASF